MKKNLLSILGLFLLSAVLSIPAQAQTVYDANFGDFNFVGTRQTNQVGTGQNVGDVVLYTNVITIGSDEIDCIVRTVSLSGGNFTTPPGCNATTSFQCAFLNNNCCSNPFDYANNNGTGLSGNADRFFSPILTFGGSGGTASFRFEFIEDGSYDASTQSGDLVILENVWVNTYDIDGNGGASSNQFVQTENFNAGQYQTGGTVVPTYNTSQELTQFRSNTTTNTSNITDNNTRLRVRYDRLSILDVTVGADGSGFAYFFLDLGEGPAWTPNTTTTAPTIDLNGSSSGIDNGDGLRCQEEGDLVSIVSDSNITSTPANLNQMDVIFNSSDIQDGADERLLIKGATSGGSIALNFANAASISNVVFFGSTYVVTAEVASGVSRLIFTPNGSGILPRANWERLLDSMAYVNQDASCSFGERDFNIRVRDNLAWSPPAVYTGNNNAPVPVTLVNFDVDCAGDMVQLNWMTASEIDNDYFEIQKSFNGDEWMSIGQIQGAGNSQQLLTYEFTDVESQRDAFYRFKQMDFDGTEHLSPVVRSRCFVSWDESLKVYPNPTTGRVVVELPYPFEASLYNLQGQAIMKESGEGMLRFDGISAGSYILNVNYEGMQKHVKLIVQ